MKEERMRSLLPGMHHDKKTLQTPTQNFLLTTAKVFQQRPTLNFALVQYIELYGPH